jgi:hypothetical protein
VKKLVANSSATKEDANGASGEEVKTADVAAEVADTAEKLDSNEDKARL